MELSRGTGSAVTHRLLPRRDPETYRYDKCQLGWKLMPILKNAKVYISIYSETGRVKKSKTLTRPEASGPHPNDELSQKFRIYALF